MKLRIITPRKVVLEEEINSITLPSADGEITILPNHVNLFSLLNEGVVKIKYDRKEDFFAIGGGYVETNGEYVNLLVSRAYGQEVVNQTATEKAIKQAQDMLQKAKTNEERLEASSILRRSIVDMKLIKKRRRTSLS
ncbi:ATP synthase F1 subunit epsilon [Candidatus Roizmanbacteria bacterium RIFCSPHIGHO2_12_FULL_33_9]|uniref:ATP synthase epsilon chain n=1 Tax=Candidatus Roizmanbacteria bacterium RIFCSPHIGHO2_12_FULL_33_9 TaxID=1802045 RepID=A0A1F7HIY0_9BACT|nr:MAG: ATP synthase F1 subunit epsilon [Candidatus Roizmanbacteria bacterium RIFCSPHIGHO2_12_FULL_33_9]